MTTASFDPQAFQAFEAAGWSVAAEPYHRLFAPVIARTLDPLLDAAQVQAGKVVLDIASGPGYIAGHAVARGAVVTGTDIAPGMVALATQLYPQITFREANAEQLPFADHSFDAVVGSMVIPHLARHDHAVSEWTRVLHPGGFLAQTMWATPDKTRLFGVMMEAIAAVRPTPPPDLPPGPPFFLYAADNALIDLFAHAGLTEITIRSLNFTQHVSDADTLWEGLLRATVRTAPVILRQSPEVQQQIRTVFDTLVAEYATDGGLELPVGVTVVSGRKPN